MEEELLEVLGSLFSEEEPTLASGVGLAVSSPREEKRKGEDSSCGILYHANLIR